MKIRLIFFIIKFIFLNKKIVMLTPLETFFYLLIAATGVVIFFIVLLLIPNPG